MMPDFSSKWTLCIVEHAMDVPDRQVTFLTCLKATLQLPLPGMDNKFHVLLSVMYLCALFVSNLSCTSSQSRTAVSRIRSAVNNFRCLGVIATITKAAKIRSKTIVYAGNRCSRSLVLRRRTGSGSQTQLGHGSPCTYTNPCFSLTPACSHNSL